MESDLLVLRVNSFIASHYCGFRTIKVPFRVGTLFVSTNYNNKDDSRGNNKPSNSNLKQLIAKIAQTEQDLEQRLMKLARTEKDLLAQIAVKEQELEQQAQAQTKASSKGTNSRVLFPSSKMNGSRLNVDDLMDSTTIDVPISSGSSSNAPPFNRPKSRDDDSSNYNNDQERRSTSLDFSEDVRKSIVTGYFIYAIGLGSTLALQAAIQAYPEEWASFVTKTQTRVQSATAPITTAATTLQDLIEETLTSARDKVSNSVDSTTNAVMDTLQAGASIMESTRTTLDVTKERAADNVEATANAVLERLKQGLSLLEENDILQQKAPSAPDNQVTDENVMMNVAEVTLDSSRVIESSVVDESIGSGSSSASDDAAVVLVPSTTNELNMIRNLAADDVGTRMEPSAEAQSIIESVNKEVDTTEVAPTLSSDNLEIKLIEETATNMLSQQQEIASVLAPTEILTAPSPLPENVKEELLEETSTNMLSQQKEIASVLARTEILSAPSPLPENVKEELLGELPSTMSAITSSDHSLGNEENIVELSFKSTIDTFDTNTKGDVTVAAAENSIIDVAEPLKFDDTQLSLMKQTNTAPEDALREAAVNTFLEALLAGEISADSVAKVDSAIDLYLQHLRQ